MPTSSGRREDYRARRREVDEGEGQHQLPSEGDELIVSRARQGAAHEDEHGDEKGGFPEEPEDGGQEGPRPAAEEEGDEQSCS